MTPKKEIQSLCVHRLQQQLCRLEEMMNHAQEEANKETKSSAGDKYETGRSMMQLEKEKNRYQKSRLGSIDVSDLEVRLNQIMIKEQAFQEEDLSLPELANRLEITAHQLSEYINHNLNQNFSGFVNQYRVQSACDLLIGEPETKLKGRAL